MRRLSMLLTTTLCVYTLVMGDAHIGHGAVVEVAVVIPVAAHETDADITEAVVDAAVEADVRPQ